MIPAKLYSSLYLLIVTVLTLFLVYRYSAYNSSRINRSVGISSRSAFFLFIFMSVFIGLRPKSFVFVDMMNYIELYPFVNINVTFQYGWNAENLIFDNIYALFSNLHIEIQLFFLLIATLYFGAIFLACKKMFPADVLYSYVIILGAFSTFSYATNGIKAGVGTSVFLLAIAYSNNKKLGILLALMSWGFHHSMYTVIVMFLLSLYIKNTKYYLYGWLFCVLCAAVHLNPLQSLMVGMADDSGVRYLTSTASNWGGKTGFRIDFLLYSATPIALGYYYIFKLKIRSAFYNRLFNIYTATNSLWVLSMYIPFNNRIAYLSWFMLPIVAIYPLFKIRIRSIHQYSFLNNIALFYISFTLFMQLIYY